jgi:hypothetical protein
MAAPQAAAPQAAVPQAAAQQAPAPQAPAPQAAAPQAAAPPDKFAALAARWAPAPTPTPAEPARESASAPDKGESISEVAAELAPLIPELIVGFQAGIIRAFGREPNRPDPRWLGKLETCSTKLLGRRFQHMEIGPGWGILLFSAVNGIFMWVGAKKLPPAPAQLLPAPQPVKAPLSIVRAPVPAGSPTIPPTGTSAAPATADRPAPVGSVAAVSPGQLDSDPEPVFVGAATNGTKNNETP